MSNKPESGFPRWQDFVMAYIALLIIITIGLEFVR